jgi:hypothetical protein
MVLQTVATLTEKAEWERMTSIMHALLRGEG